MQKIVIKKCKVPPKKRWFAKIVMKVTRGIGAKSVPKDLLSHFLQYFIALK